MSEVQKIRILRIINRFNLGGPTYNAAYLTKHIGNEFETKLIGGIKDDSEASSEYMLEQIGVEAQIIPEMKRSISFDDVEAYKNISKIIQDFNPHIVHTHASKAGTLGRLAAINHGVPIIIHTFHGHVFHSYFGKLTTGFYKMIERWLAKRTTAIIAISEQQRIELVEKHKIFKPDKARVVPLGFDLTRFTENKESKRTAFRDEYRLTEKDVAIVIVGRLVPIKNHKMFLNSIRLIIDSGKSNARFFIVGDGESREGLMRYSESQGIGYTKQAPPTRENPLCFTSWIRDVDRVYAGCDIVCLTSYNEGTPVSLIEAQATEKPIVSTRVGGINDIVLENQSAFLVDSDDFSALAGRISELIENNLLRTQMGMSGSDNVLTRFTYANLCSNMRSIYIDELKRRNIPYS